MRSVARASGLRSLERFEDSTADAERDMLERYALDPWAHVDDGHIYVPDLETVQETVWVPWPDQRAIVDAWVDLSTLHIARPGDEPDTVLEPIDGCEQCAAGVAGVHGHPSWNNVHLEKSRQEGASLALAYAGLWGTMYHTSPSLAISLKFEEIDDGGSGSTLDSHFGRIRYMWERIPEELRQPLEFKYGLVRHAHRAGSFIAAEGASPDPGRGSRYASVLIDEAARLAFGEAAHSALTRACPRGRFYNSTPHGEGNVYFRLRKDRPKNYTFLRIHWTTHPVYSIGLHTAGEKPSECALCAGNRAGVRWEASDPRAHRYPGKPTSPWYDEAVLELTDDEVASELDIDYEGSLSSRVYPEFSELIHVVPEGIPYDRDIEAVELLWDYGLDVTYVGIAQDAPHELRLIGEVEVAGNATPDIVAPALKNVLADLGMPLRLLSREWTLQLLAVGDPAGEGRDLATGKPLTAHYRRHGFRIRSRKQPFATTVLALKRLMTGQPKPLRVSGTGCPLFISHAKNNRRRTDARGNPVPGPLSPSTIVDDEHNHAMRAAAYYAAYKFPPRSAADSIRDAKRRFSPVPPRATESERDERWTTGKHNPGLSYDMDL